MCGIVVGSRGWWVWEDWDGRGCVWLSLQLWQVLNDPTEHDVTCMQGVRVQRELGALRRCDPDGYPAQAGRCTSMMLLVAGYRPARIVSLRRGQTVVDSACTPHWQTGKVLACEGLLIACLYCVTYLLLCVACLSLHTTHFSPTPIVGCHLVVRSHSDHALSTSVAMFWQCFVKSSTLLQSSTSMHQVLFFLQAHHLCCLG